MKNLVKNEISQAQVDSHLLYVDTLGFYGMPLNESGNTISAATVNGADLSLSTFDRSVLTGCSFDKTSFATSSFDMASITETTFRDCNLNNARFMLAKFNDVVFENCDMSATYFLLAKFVNVRFINCESVKHTKSDKYEIISIKNDDTTTHHFEGLSGTTHEMMRYVKDAEFLGLLIAIDCSFEIESRNKFWC